jgi:hypothetical protein
MAFNLNALYCDHCHALKGNAATFSVNQEIRCQKCKSLLGTLSGKMQFKVPLGEMCSKGHIQDGFDLCDERISVMV